ncbi:hypothetical protein ACEUAI_13425 [Aeromonas veronii]
MFISVHALQETIHPDWLEWVCKYHDDAKNFFEDSMNPAVLEYHGFATLSPESLHLFFSKVVNVCLEKIGVFELGPFSVVNYKSPKIDEKYLLGLTKHISFGAKHASLLMDILIADFSKRGHYKLTELNQGNGSNKFEVRHTKGTNQLNRVLNEALYNEVFSVADIDKFICTISDLVISEGQDIAKCSTLSRGTKKEITTSDRTAHWRHTMLLLSDIPKYQSSVQRFFVDHEKIIDIFGGNREYVEASYSLFKVKSGVSTGKPATRSWLPISNIPKIDIHTFVDKIDDPFISIDSLFKQVEHLQLSNQQLQIVYNKATLLHDVRAVSVFEWLLKQSNLSRECRGSIAQKVWYERELPFGSDTYKLPWSVDTITQLLKDKRLLLPIHANNMLESCVERTASSLEALLIQLQKTAVETKKDGVWWDGTIDKVSRHLIEAFYFPLIFKDGELDHKQFIKALEINFRELSTVDLPPLFKFGLREIIDEIPEFAEYMSRYNPDFSELMTSMILESKLQEAKACTPKIVNNKVSRSL